MSSIEHLAKAAFLAAEIFAEVLPTALHPVENPP